MALEQITDGMSGAEAAQTIYENDLANQQAAAAAAAAVQDRVEKGGYTKTAKDLDDRTKGFITSQDDTTPAVEMLISSNGKVLRTVDGLGRHKIELHPESEVPSGAVSGLSGAVESLPIMEGARQVFKINEGGIYAGYTNGRARRIDTDMGQDNTSDKISAILPPLQNVAYSEWVSPLFVEVPELDAILGAPVKRGLPAQGPFAKKMGHVWALNAKYKQQFDARELMPILYHGVNSQPIQALWTVDDHNAGCVLVDLRPTAAAPVTIIQNDHGSPYKPRIAELDFDNELIGSIRTLGAAGLPVTYGQISRNPANPDHILYVYREGGSNIATWSVAQSTDNGATWSKVTLFGDGTGSDYLLSREARDGTGIHIIGCMHPISGTIQTVVHLHLSWDGVLSDSINGVHIEDIFAGDNNYNMFLVDNARLLRAPVVGKRTRLHDFFEVEENVIEVVISEFIHSGDYSGQTKGQEYRHIKFNTTATTITSDTRIMAAGWPQEINAGQNDYFCGGTVIGPDTLIMAVWDAASQSDANAHKGIGTLYKCRRLGAAWEIETLKTLQNKKFSRPKVGVSFRRDPSGVQRMTMGQFYYVMEGTYYNFGDWDLSLNVYKI